MNVQLSKGKGKIFIEELAPLLNTPSLTQTKESQREAKASLFLSSPSPLKERGIKGVRLTYNP